MLGDRCGEGCYNRLLDVLMASNLTDNILSGFTIQVQIHKNKIKRVGFKLVHGLSSVMDRRRVHP